MQPLFCWSRPFPAAALIAVVSIAGCGGLVEKTESYVDAPTDSGTDGAPVLPAPTCTDGVKNGTETDVDCGGATCTATGNTCGAASMCATDADCRAGTPCRAGKCEPPLVYAHLDAGEFHTCAILEEGALKCWGDNAVGELGVGDRVPRGNNRGDLGFRLHPIDLGAGRKVLSVSAGHRHTCAILDDGTLKCWGRNDVGQLGLGDTDNRGDTPFEMGDNLPAVDLGSGRTAISVAAGNGYTCAILDDRTVKCWGDNVYGQLGLGDSKNRGGKPGQMGNSLPTVNLGTRRRALAIAAYSNHTCAILDNGSVKCWGENQAGKLGLGDRDRHGDNPGEMGDALPAVDLGVGRQARAVTVGRHHSCAVLDNGSVKCWGGNDYDGPLGLGDRSSRGGVPGQMGDALPSLDLGAGRTALSLSAGDGHTCATLDNHTIKCWGFNGFGQLGIGDTDDRGDDPGEMEALPTVRLGAARSALAVTGGGPFTCGLLDDGTVKCWGGNPYGVLGLGDDRTRGDEPGEMGDNLRAVDLGARVR